MNMSVLRLILSFKTKDSVYRNVRYISCWSCGHRPNGPASSLFCSQCNVIQRPELNANYFKIMGVSETYDLDESDLQKRYKNLQRHLHPDKYANRGSEELKISEEYSSLVNEAYKTLLEPLNRVVVVRNPPIGIYMLQLRGKDLLENTEVDQEFLIQIMKKNEEVEEAETEGEIMQINKENKAKIKELQKLVSSAFFEGDMARVNKLLSHMKYYTSIDNQIQGVIRSKGIIR